MSIPVYWQRRSTPCYLVYADPETLARARSGGTEESVLAAAVHDQVFVARRKSGLWNRASRVQLANDLEVEEREAAIARILREGRAESRGDVLARDATGYSRGIKWIP